MKSETLRGIKYSAIALAVTLGMTACSLEGDDGEDGVQGPVGEQGPAGEPGPVGDTAGTLTRIATVPLGAEVTGIFLTDEGDLFFNV